MTPVRQRVAQKLNAVKLAARERARRAARPVRLIAAGMTVVVLLTALWLWHRARVDAASATIVAIVPQAEQALDERDFGNAERLFADAVAAFDLLGARDETALRVRQRYREVVAANGLAAQTPYDLAAEAEALAANPTQWTDRFDASYAGRWVILDVPLGSPEAPTPNSSDSSAADRAERQADKVVRLDIPLVAGRYPVRFEIDSRLFKPIGSPSRAIFAAQYESWRLHTPSKDGSAWVVRLNSQTAVLWTSPDTYAALGFDLDDPAAPPRAVLERQAKALRIPMADDVDRQGVRSAKEAPSS